VEGEKPPYWGDWTFQIGFGGMVFGGVNARGDISLAFDGRGNIGFFKSIGGGGDTSLGANIGFFLTVTNAPSISKLKGTSVQVGGQIGAGASLSGEFEIFSDPDTGNIYDGVSIGGGGQLSPRQKQVAAYVCRGDTTRQIAAQLNISQTTVKSHVEIILRKFGINSRASLRQLLAPWDLTSYL